MHLPLLKFCSVFGVFCFLGLSAQTNEEKVWQGEIGSEEAIVIEDTSEDEHFREKLIDHMLNDPYPIRRLFRYDDINIKQKTVRFESGKKATLVYAWPRKAKKSPVVFVCDVESMSLTDPNLIGKRRKGNMSRSAYDSLRLNYMLKSPFGSNLLGNGFAVAYLISDDLESLRSARIVDWLEIFEQVRGHRRIDGNSFFLLSTREYATRSLYLTANYTFSAVVMEEPEYMLFSRSAYQDVVNRSSFLSSEQIWKRTNPNAELIYENYFSQIRSPLLVIRENNSGVYDFNQKTLFTKLDDANVFFEEVFVAGRARSISNFAGRNGVMDENPVIRYRHEPLSTWMESMITYFKANSTTQPQQLASVRELMGR